MFKRVLMCGLVLGMTSVAAMAATTSKGTEQGTQAQAPSASSASVSTSTSTTDSQNRSLINKAILILHGGKTMPKMQSLTDDSNPECMKCH